MTRLSARQTTAAGVFLTEIAAAVVVWRRGPKRPIPLHFNILGRPDGYGDRVELALLIAVLAVLGAGCWMLLETMRRQAQRPAGLASAQGVLLAAFGLIGALLAVLAFAPTGAGVAPFSGRAPMAAGALLMLCIGAVLGKVGPNPVVGVRTFWSLNSRLAWEKSNRLGGRLLFWIGLAGLAAAPFAPQPFGAAALFTAAILAAGAAMFESWRVWSADPDRAAF